MKKIYSLLLIFLLLLNIDSAESNQSSIDNEVLHGLNDIYNLKFDDAESRFKQLQKSNSNDIRGYFYESLIYFYKAIPSRNDELFEKYMDLSENVISRADELLERNENDFDALYYKGLSHSYRSLLMLSLNKSLLKAALNGNDGYRILSSLIEEKPDYYDAYMGLGLYKIAIGFVPEKFQWLLSLIGFEGDIKDGIRLLKAAMSNGKYTKADSKFFLAIFSLKEREDDNSLALKYSKELSEQYPESPLFKVFYSSFQLQQGFNTEAISSANEALNLNRNSFQNDIKKAANSVLGSAFFKLNDYKQAVTHLEEFMKYRYENDRLNVYLFLLGVSYELNGDRNKALEKYKAVRNNFINERDGELDRLFYRYAQEKIKNPLNDFDIRIIRGLNLRESNKLDEAISVFNEIAEAKFLQKYNSDDCKIRLYYDLGVTYSYKKDYDKAKENFYKCIALKPETEKWLIPHSYFELGKIYDKSGDKTNSENMFEMIYNYDDFDFESFLEMRLANYKNKLSW